MITKYRLTLGIGYSNSNQEEIIDIEDYFDLPTWNKMSGNEKDKHLCEIWIDWSNNYIDGGYSEVE